MCMMVVFYGCAMVCVLFRVRARCRLPPATPSYASWELHLQLRLRSLATLMFLCECSISLGMCVRAPLYVASSIELYGLDEMRLR
jgi:hypothetical protein